MIPIADIVDEVVSLGKDTYGISFSDDAQLAAEMGIKESLVVFKSLLREEALRYERNGNHIAAAVLRKFQKEFKAD